MPKMKYIFFAIVPLLIGVFLMFRQQTNTSFTINELTQKLQKKMDKELFVDVVDSISEYKGEITVDLLYFKAKAYEGLKQLDEAIAVYEEIIQTFPQEKAAYDKLLGYYESEYPQKYIRLLYDMKKIFPQDSGNHLMAYALKFQKTYVPANRLFNSSSDYIVFEYDGKYGIMTKEMEVLVEAEFDKLLDYSEDTGFFGAVKDGKAFYVDEQGYKREVPDILYQELGYQIDGMAVAKKEGKFGYIDYKLNELSEFVYEDATAFRKGIAAIKEKGKWYFINDKFEKIKNESYDMVLMNRNRVMNAVDVIWVKKDNRWQLLNNQLKSIDIPVVKQVKIFISNEPTAVEFENGWGYLTTSGKTVNHQRFLNANPFNVGKAFVQVEKGKWQVISNEFDKGDMITANHVDIVYQAGVAQVFETDKMNYFVKFNQLKEDME